MTCHCFSEWAYVVIWTHLCEPDEKNLGKILTLGLGENTGLLTSKKRT